MRVPVVYRLVECAVLPQEKIWLSLSARTGGSSSSEGGAEAPIAKQDRIQSCTRRATTVAHPEGELGLTNQ